jgi:hypothetical protein
MAKPTPVRQALHALRSNLSRSESPVAAQLEDDRLNPDRKRRAAAGRRVAGIPAAARAVPFARSPRIEHDVPATVRHTMDRSGTTHTFCFHSSAHRALGACFAVFGVICLAEAAAAPITAGHLGGSWRDEIVVICTGFLTVWGGIRAFRVGVHISGEKLTIRDEFRTRKVSADAIRAITLQSKTMSAAGSHWLPRVDLIDGNGVWITNFDCGPADRPPPPELAAAVAEVRAPLGAGADDIPGPDSLQPGDAH